MILILSRGLWLEIRASYDSISRQEVGIGGEREREVALAVLFAGEGGPVLHDEGLGGGVRGERRGWRGGEKGDGFAKVLRVLVQQREGRGLHGHEGVQASTETKEEV